MKLMRVARFHRVPKGSVALFGLCALLRFAGVAAAQDQLKVGVVDMSKVFAGYYKTGEAEGTIREAREAAKKEYDGRMENHHRLLEEIARIDKQLADPALSAADKADRVKQRNDKVEETHVVEQDMKDYKASRERQLQEQTIRVRTQIVEDIMVVVNARVERDHYNLILNKSAQGLGGKTLVLHANDSLELTADVIAALNKNRPAAAAPAPAASATP